ncbi:putative cytosolic 5'-nucleotidase 3-like [Capsicum annuum]|nr:putative cytosolic 5'-nucleotidase 3-like [Capsicum annuum]
MELRNTHEASEIFLKFIMSAPVSLNPGKALLTDKNGGGSLKAGLRKVKFLKALSFRRHKKAYHAEEGSNSDRRNSVRSEDPDYVYPVDTDSLDEDLVGESEEGKEDTSVQKSFSYEALVYANHADTKHKYPEDETAANQSAEQSSKRSLLSWRKRYLSFKYPKTKGEPLLKRHYGEDGADDIDFDRRQLCSSDESSSRVHKSEETSPISVSSFGDKSFTTGCWEQKEIISRDGQMKLQTQVFFDSIDKQSERAAGESACTTLVAVIDDWFHCNPKICPSSPNLILLSVKARCILEAKVRPLSVVSEKSFIGFFHPEGIEEEEGFHFLHGSMSFDNIWDEISKSAQETPRHGDSCVYIAYILKFDQDTTSMQASCESQQSDAEPSCDRKEKTDVKEAADESKIVMSTNSDDSMQEDTVPEKNIIYRAIPIRELQVDVKKGLMALTPLHQRLQIEFHYTMSFVPKFEESSSEQLIANSLAIVPSASAE